MAIKVGDALLMVGADTKDLDQGMDRVNKNIKQGTDKWKGQLRAAGAAFTAVGVAGLALVASAKKLNASLGQTAMTLGATTGELRDLALAVTNVTFPLESVTATFEILARAGIRDQNVLAASATAFDTLADATGSSAEAVAKQLIPAFKLFDVEIPKSADELDNFTWLTKNTTVELSEFGGVMSYVAQYGADLNLTLDDMVAIMAVLESKGQSGSTATKMFRTAVTQAASGASTLNEALGITNEEVAHFRDEMSAANGITQDYADVANTQYGLMDKLKQKWSEITLTMGSFLEPLEPIMGAMAAIGPLMMVLSTSMGQAAVKTIAHTVSLVAHRAAMLASTIATGALTAAQWLWNAAITANPIGLIIIAIAGFVAALVGIIKHFDKVKSAMTKAWDYLKILFATSIRVILEKAIRPFLGALAKIIDVGASIVGFFNKEWGESMRRAADSVRGAIDSAIEWTYELEDNARAHLEQKDAVEEATRITNDAIVAANEYDAALYGMTGMVESATAATEDLVQASRDAIQALQDHKDEVAGFETRWLEFLGTLEPSVQLWDDIGASAEDAFELMVEMSGQTQEHLARFFSQAKIDVGDWSTNWKEKCELAGVSGEEFIAALEERFGDLSEVASATASGIAAEMAAAAEEATAATEAAQAAAEAEAEAEAAAASTQWADLQAGIAGQPDWYRALASTIYNLSEQGEITLPAELTRELENLVKGAFEEGTDWFAIIQAVEANKAQIWEEMLERQYQVLSGGYVHHWAELIEGLDVAGMLSGIIGTYPVEAFQHGGLISEPTLLYGLRSHRPYAIAGEAGTEVVSPVGRGGTTNNFNIAQLTVREEADIRRIAEELYRLGQLRSVIHG